MGAGLKKYLTTALLAVVVFLAVSSIIAFMNLPWPLSVFQLAKQQLIFWNTAALILLLMLRQRRFAAVPAVLIALNYWGISVPPYVKPIDEFAADQGLTVVWANVVFNTPTLNNAIAYAKAQHADLVLLGAVPQKKDLLELAPEFPFRYESNGDSQSCKSASRIVALSRLPIFAMDTLPGPPCGNRQFIRFNLLADEVTEPLTVIAAHVDAPLSAESSRERDYLIGKIAASTGKGPYLLAGDFNATPWSWAYSQLPGRRIGAPQWETTVRQWQFTSWSILAFALPVDHFLVSDTVHVGLYAVGPDIGSIHRPIVTRIMIDSALIASDTGKKY